MKKRIHFFFLFFLFGVKGLAADPVECPGAAIMFGVMFANNGGGVLNPAEGHTSIPRTPMVFPKVSQDGHTLYFNNVGYDLTLVLLDDEENEVYSALVPAGATAVMLPSSLNGTYELQKRVY